MHDDSACSFFSRLPTLSACPGASPFIVLLVMSGIITLAAPASPLPSIRRQRGERTSEPGSRYDDDGWLSEIDFYKAHNPPGRVAGEIKRKKKKRVVEVCTFLKSNRIQCKQCSFWLLSSFFFNVCYGMKVNVTKTELMC